MSLMLNTLKTLEGRRQQVAPPRTLSVRREAPALRICPVADDSPAAEPVALPANPRASACLMPTVAELSEAYHDLAAHVVDQLAETGCNLIAFVGCDNDCAGSFSLVEAAQAFALRAHGRVLLVEGDMHERSISSTAGAAGPGLAELWLGKASWPDVVHPTQLADVDFVSSGSEPAIDVAARLDWQPMREEYQFVLVGTVRPAQAETTCLASQADAVYLVVSRRGTRCRDAVSTLNRLRRAGANVLGSIVIND